MSDDIRICFIGDSFVNGTGDESALGWAGRLCAAAAGEAEITCYNLGVRRDTSGDILRRWRAECTPRLPDLCDGRVVLSCGVNDTVIEEGRLRVEPEVSRDNVRSILRGAGSYPLLMVGPPPVDDGEQNRRIEALSAVYAEEAASLGVPFVDLFTPLVDDAAYLAEVAGNDGAHPTSVGYSKMARVIASSPHWWFRNG